MVVRMELFDSLGRHTRTYRDIFKHKGLAELRESFYALEDLYDHGELIQLKGNERIKLGAFGPEQDE